MTLDQLLSVPSIPGPIDDATLEALFWWATGTGVTTADRARAIHGIDKLMGLPPCPYDDWKTVELFMASLVEGEPLIVPVILIPAGSVYIMGLGLIRSE